MSWDDLVLFLWVFAHFAAIQHEQDLITERFLAFHRGRRG